MKCSPPQSFSLSSTGFHPVERPPVQVFCHNAPRRAPMRQVHMRIGMGHPHTPRRCVPGTCQPHCPQHRAAGYDVPGEKGRNDDTATLDSAMATVARTGRRQRADAGRPGNSATSAPRQPRRPATWPTRHPPRHRGEVTRGGARTRHPPGHVPEHAPRKQDAAERRAEPPTRHGHRPTVTAQPRSTGAHSSGTRSKSQPRSPARDSTPTTRTRYGSSPTWDESAHWLNTNETSTEDGRHGTTAAQSQTHRVRHHDLR